MTRFVSVNGIRCEVSKSEASQLAAISIRKPEFRQIMFDEWLVEATPEARKRRIAVGKALKLKVPE